MTARLSRTVSQTMREGGPQAVISLAKTARGPIIEETPDAGSFDVTFVFSDPRGEPGRAGLFCAALPEGFADLHDLGGGVFAGTFAMPAGTRVKYHFCPDPPGGLDAAGLFRLAHSPQAMRLDRLNPSLDQVHLRGLRVRIVESLLSLPGASAPLPVRRLPGVPAGAAEELVIDSRALGRRKHAVIYRPSPQAGPDWPALLPVVLLLQGNEEWQETGFFDNLIAAGEVPPFTAVLFRERSFTARLREFSGGAEHTRFIADELWPRLDGLGVVSAGGATVAGFSAGGLAAAALALDEPGLFPRLAVVSGALHLTRGTDLNVVSDGASALLLRLAQAEPGRPGSVPCRAYVAAGRFEDGWEKAIYANAVALAEALRGHGTAVRFDTGPTGHDNVSARAYLAAGLRWLLG